MEHDPRVVFVESPSQVCMRLREDFRDVNIALRGIIASIGRNVDLPYVVEEEPFKGMKVPFVVKSIDRVLEDGSELNPETNFFWTFADPTRGSNWAYTFVADEQFINYFCQRSGALKEEKNLLRRAVLIYDASRLEYPPERVNRYAVKVPENPQVRREIILKAYVIAPDAGRESQ